MKILFLDDDLERCKRFEAFIKAAKEHKKEIEYTIVHTAKDTIENLTSQYFDIISLDHDLGGEVYVNSNREDCGMEVVRHILNTDAKQGVVIIHTFNTVAGSNMLSDLGIAYEDGKIYHRAYAPFGTDGYWQYLKHLLYESKH